MSSISNHLHVECGEKTVAATERSGQNVWMLQKAALGPNRMRLIATRFSDLRASCCQFPSEPLYHDP